VNQTPSEDLSATSCESYKPTSIVRAGVLFEASLVLVALGLGYWLEQPALQNLLEATPWENVLAVGVGLLATVPMLAALVVIRRLSWGPVRRLCRLVDEHLMPLFADASLFGLLLLSLAAGLGEEVLFRGVLQNWFARWFGGDLGSWGALLLVSLLFGCCHWLNATYAVFAFLVGLYLGIVYWLSGSLLCVVVAHAVYDFVALVWLLRLAAVEAENKKAVVPEDHRFCT
jgi:membrane protease YdiL (CAAX protease family)